MPLAQVAPSQVRSRALKELGLVGEAEVLLSLLNEHHQGKCMLIRKTNFILFL